MSSTIKLSISLNHADDEIGASLPGDLAQSLGGRAGDINGVGPVALPGMASLWATASDDCAEP